MARPLLVAHDEHLATLLHVDFVDEAPVEHLHLVDVDVVRVDTADARRDVLLSETDDGTGVVLRAHLVYVLRKLLGRNLHIAFVETNVAAFLQALIGL